LSLGIGTFVTENLLKKDQILTRAIVAIDRNSGKFQWACEALNKPEGMLHRYNSAASPTPVIKDNRVFAYFGSGGAMCSDINGQLLWTNEEIVFHSAYGAGASPCVGDGVLVIVNGMPDDGYVCGLDCLNGKTIWRKPMRGNAVSGNSRTPIALKLNGKMTALVWGFAGLTGFDVATGDELFSYPIGNGGGDQVSSIVTDGESLFCIGGATAISLHLDQLGQTSDPPIAWTRKVGAVNCASPVLANGMAFCVTDTGIASCLDLKTGATCWRQRLEGSYYASPIVCGHHVYFTNLDGLTSVVEVDRNFKLVSENGLTGQFLASAAPFNGEIYLRSSDRLYRIGGPYRQKTSNSIAWDKRPADGAF
jgi:outer membrane protein assembly factor BamB